jgi:hypothetical protein
MTRAIARRGALRRALAFYSILIKAKRFLESLGMRGGGYEFRAYHRPIGNSPKFALAETPRLVSSTRDSDALVSARLGSAWRLRCPGLPRATRGKVERRDKEEKQNALREIADAYEVAVRERKGGRGCRKRAFACVEKH